MTNQTKCKAVKAWAIKDTTDNRIWSVRMRKEDLTCLLENDDEIIEVYIREVTRKEK